MKKIYTTLLLFLISYIVLAQEKSLQTLEETQNLSKITTKFFSENKISKAIKELTPYWPLPQNELESMEEKTIKYINLVEDRFGHAIDIVKVNNETIGEIAIRETYLVRYEYSAIRLIFTYYKNKNGWLVNSFKWDDSFTEEFK